MNRDPGIEFNLIDLIQRHSPVGDAVVGIGDDAAVLDSGFLSGRQLVTCVDQSVAGRHFPDDTPPFSVGHKSLAVNLSDMAAMGATPHHALLTLSLPEASSDWLDEFMGGFSALARECNVQLVGGDTCRGPLAISVTLIGSVPVGQALLRNAATAGDLIAVSGFLGEAACALDCVLSGEACSPQLLTRLNEPQPRLALGQGLRQLATACIDISDGLVSDLGHILQASAVGADLAIDTLPLSDELRHQAGRDRALGYAMTGGDDYELCFCLPPASMSQLETLAARVGVPVQCIGEVRSGSDLTLYDGDQRVDPQTWSAYAHF